MSIALLCRVCLPSATPGKKFTSVLTLSGRCPRDDPPGNFLSRFVIGNVCFCFGMLQFILWRPERPNFKHASLFMALGIFSTFCLSVVGAICDSASDKECRGNNTIHSTAAVTFFVLYNMNMVLLTSKGGRWKAPSLLLPVLLSAICKARWLFSSSEALAPQDLTFLAIIEWSDVPYCLPVSLPLICIYNTSA